MFRNPVSPRGLWESSVVLSESESSAFVGTGSGLGTGLVLTGAQQFDPELWTRGLDTKCCSICIQESCAIAKMTA